MNNTSRKKLNINKLTRAPKNESDSLVSVMKGVIGSAIVVTVFGLLITVFPLTKTSQRIQTAKVTGGSISALDVLKGSAASSDTSIIGLSGTIKDIESDQFTLTLANGQNAKIQTDSNTEILQELKISETVSTTQKVPIGRSDLKKGANVEILAKTNGGSLLQGVAQKILVTQ
ncbi:MAG: hypothetical protein V1853_05100 [bacterium]